jgi:chaperone required for assembly of F1-ATPase
LKRFYKDVAVGTEADGLTVLLDAKPVRTPARHVLILPTQALAEAVAEEWRQQGETLEPQGMRVTRLAITAIDLMPGRRGDAVEEVAGYAGTDLLCYRADHPANLVARQAAAWQPWLDWAEQQHDARLVPASGIMPVAQPEPALRALHAAVERLGDWRLVGLHAATTLLGSLVLGLAFERGAIDSEQAFTTALLDELFEMEQWGEDDEQIRRHARIRADLVAADRYLRLLPG